MKLWIPLVTGFATYLLLTLFFGEYGVVNYRKLQAEQRRMATHLSLLEQRRSDLLIEEQQLTGSEERIRLEARSLGFLEGEQRILRIGGRRSAERRSWIAGSVVRAEADLPDHSSSIRAIAICSALLSLILTLSTTKGDRRGRRRQAPEEEEERYSIRRASM